jgi:molybdenum cofactor guanylyltransferase
VNLSAVILAGGRSQRMGRDKAWIELDGRPLIARQIDCARSVGASEIFISGRASVDYSHFECPVLIDDLDDAGPLAGIERALAAAAAPLVLVLAVDMPRLTAEWLRRLVARCEPHRGVVPGISNRLEPLAAIYPRVTHPIARRLLIEQNGSPRQFAELCVRNDTVRIWPVAPADAPRFASWNLPSDIQSQLSQIPG